jgi:hypothetical protein
MGSMSDVLPNGRVVVDVLAFGSGTFTPLTFPPRLSWRDICDTKGEGVVRPVDGGNFVA